MWDWIKKLFKKSNNPVYNVHHPELRDKVEEVFRCAGKTYYRFKEEFQMPTGRYKWVLNYLREVDLRMDIELYKTYIKELKKHLDAQTGKINLGEAWKIILNMESRANLAFEPEGVKRLASVVYFDETEALNGYSIKYNRQKMDFWDKHEFLDFFLTNPIAELLSLKDTSIESLEEYIQTSSMIIKELTLEQPKV